MVTIKNNKLTIIIKVNNTIKQFLKKALYVFCV